MRDINERSGASAAAYSNSRYHSDNTYYNNYYYNNNHHHQQHYNNYNNRYNKENNKLNKFSSLNKPEYLQFKLSDLINSNASFVIDNLYAQFQSDSKQISLFYMPPSMMNQQTNNSNNNNKLPDNSMLLSAKLLFNYNRTNLTDTRLLSNNSVNLLLNEFYLLAAKSQSNNTSSMDSFNTHRLQISELFLILFVISLWFISIVFCVRRSSLVLCFHKRDVPFYDSSKENQKKKSNLSIVKSVTVTSANANNLIDNDSLLLQQNQQQQQYQDQQTLLQQSSLCSCNDISLIRDDLKLNELLIPPNEPFDQSTVIDMKTLSNQNSHTDSSFMKNSNNNDSFCSKCNKKISFSKNFSYSSYNNDNNLSILNNNESKSASDTYVFNEKISNQSSNHNNVSIQQSKSLHYNPRVLHDKIQYSQLYDTDCEYYYSNGILYSTKQRSASVLLNKAATKTKFTKMDKLNRMNSMVSNTSNTNAHNLSDTDLKQENFFSKISTTNHIKPLKLNSIGKQHFNLVSLDEEALISYNKQHKFIKRQQNPSSTNALTESIRSSNLSRKLTKNYTNKQGKLGLTMPFHANFISLRSGSVTSQGTCFIKSDISDDFDSTQMIRTASIQNQQQHNRSRSSSIANNSSSQNINIQTNQTTSQRQINPLSTLRRHMFANSHYKTKTNQTLSFYGDSTNLSYETANSTTSNNQLSTNNMQNGTNLSSEIIREDSYCSIPDNLPTNLANTQKDPNLLDPYYINPNWIPDKVKECLLELHKDTKSQSDSNIKFRNRSSNQLLHSYGRNGRRATLKEIKNKKALSLQNSQEKTIYYQTNSHRNSVIINFYDELKNKIFQNKYNNNTNNSNTNTTSTSLSLAYQNSANLSDNTENMASTNIVFRNSPSIIFDEPSKELFSESDKSTET